ncbi:putative tubulin polyglutamylase TTLL2, partial [Nibea albiflora]
QEDRNAVQTLWADAVVPYTISDELAYQEPNIQAAFRMISDFTCIRFRRHTTEFNYLKFLEGNGCASFVGCQGGAQVVYYSPSCSVGNLCHELIHALGLHHEHTRKDRDQYITVQWQSIIPGREKNFKMKRGDSLNLPYDIHSIMHYGQYFFSLDGSPTVLAKNGGRGMGQRTHLSHLDVQRLNRLYHCGNSSLHCHFTTVSGGAKRTDCLLYPVSQKAPTVYLPYIYLTHRERLFCVFSLRCCMAASLVFRLHDRGPEVVREVLLERGWVEYSEGKREKEDWNLYWRGSAFRNSEYHSLLPWQRLNHHPKTVGITRKDCLARNLRRMRATFSSSLYDFSPTAFILPNDYTRFLAEYNRLRQAGPSVYWICKPVDLSRGRGIFIFEDIKDLVYDCSVIVQRYISSPLLISGYKFDLRIYVCVKSFHPLTVYVHQEGLVRFATEKYNLSSLHNTYAHLTNTSINKFGPFYKTEKGRVGQGCKWTMSKFRHYLHSQDINELLLWQRISNIVTLTLLTIAPSVPSCPNCVELFGFDILLDVRFKPWLLEVNYSPALTLDCQADITVKKALISDLIDLMNYTLTDSLRKRAFYRQGSRQPCFHASHMSRVTPVISKVKETKVGNQSSQTQTLPQLKTLCQAERMNRRPFIDDYQRHFPPVDSNQLNAATKTHTDKNLILGPHSRTNMSVVNRQTCAALAPRLMDDASLRVSEVTNHDDTETEAETQPPRKTNVSSSIHETPQRGLRFRRSAGSWKLPNIYSGNHRPVRIPLEGTTAVSGQNIPPPRVGGFIRTFPFNAATLRASQQKLDVKLIIQELHKLTGQLAASDQKLRREEEEEVKRNKDGEEDFDSLLWGPKEPPLLSQCSRHTQ